MIICLYLFPPLDFVLQEGRRLILHKSTFPVPSTVPGLEYLSPDLNWRRALQDWAGELAHQDAPLHKGQLQFSPTLPAGTEPMQFTSAKTHSALSFKYASRVEGFCLHTTGVLTTYRRNVHSPSHSLTNQSQAAFLFCLLLHRKGRTGQHMCWQIEILSH